MWCSGREFGLSARGTVFETSNFQFLYLLYNCENVSLTMFLVFVAPGAPFGVLFYIVPGRVTLYLYNYT